MGTPLSGPRARTPLHEAAAYGCELPEDKPEPGSLAFVFPVWVHTLPDHRRH